MAAKAIQIRELQLSECTNDCLNSFNRYQEVTRCWRNENGSWISKDIRFTEQWDDAQKLEKVYSFIRCIKNSGSVLGAYCDKCLIGFCNLDHDFFGSEKQYVQLGMLHVSYEYRNKGIGKRLFLSICEKAKHIGAQKLYISAHSSQETQAIYKSLGCIEAREVNRRLADKEPCDCQLEYVL